MSEPDAFDRRMPDGRHCPSCGGTLERVHRHALDRWVSLFRNVHRYRCLDQTCAWEGVLGRDAASLPVPARWPALLLAFAAGAAVALAGVQGARMLKQRAAEVSRAAVLPVVGAAARSQATAPGVDFPGAELPPTDPRVRQNPSPLRLRHSCAWGVPGGNPYRGTVAQALAAARLPPEVVKSVAEMADRGWVSDQIAISRDSIRSVNGQREFGTEVRAMAFGDLLCFNTRVNFPPGHVEYAAMYQTRDANGKLYTVMVPYVCQNVSVLGEREEIVEGNGVSTPATWTLVAGGLGLLVLFQGRRARRVGAK